MENILKHKKINEMVFIFSVIQFPISILFHSYRILAISGIIMYAGILACILTFFNGANPLTHPDPAVEYFEKKGQMRKALFMSFVPLFAFFVLIFTVSMLIFVVIVNPK